MTKTALKNFTDEIARKRRQVWRLKEDVGDLLDHPGDRSAGKISGPKAAFDR